MQELIQKIAEKAGITPEQAQIAFQTAQEYFAQQKTNASTATGENKDGFLITLKKKLKNF
jgi:diketogulonate reductase-like aldo/keto reductase